MTFLKALGVVVVFTVAAMLAMDIIPVLPSIDLPFDLSFVGIVNAFAGG